MTHSFSRRRFLRGVGLLGASVAASGLVTPFLARGAGAPIRIVSNPGLENATLNALMDELGFFKRFGVNAQIVEFPGVKGPFDAIAADAGDVCMVSGYNLVLSRITQGANVKIVGAGMKRCALTVFARPDGAKTLSDLKHKTVAVGPANGLLHSLMLQLLKERGVDASQIRFVDKGSNDQCHEAVVKGEVDASCSSISHLNDRDGLVVINDGNMWQALPHCIFQTAYASDEAIRDKHDDLVAVMAAYGALYDYLMSPDSRDAFFAARKHAQKRFDAASAQAIWQFNETERPYSRDLSLTHADIAYLQDMYIGLGSLDRKQPFAEVADMSAAHAAAKLIA
ncbi:NitT/TauT family transport system substrate-binding protein [Paraburkholderia tropica]|uniref:ABC transporter substrate-binding protein n=1 Tax=Paraburkholderia tropica TaxID=92647 RepID=UPI001CAE7576|nr:ABC transporter substrate-binding protein [Paraburkholderia tropica]CAG9223072.1 NitT/TauT family transport system substrate-binding protein [Paraburkholderia tropica]